MKHLGMKLMFAMLLVSLKGFCDDNKTLPYSFVVDGIYYHINDEPQTVSVWYSWKYAATGNPWNRISESYSGDVVIPDCVTYEGVSYNVTAIGEWAFYNCTGLTSVTIPNTVERIGRSALSGSNQISNINIPEGVSQIGVAAFSGSVNLKTITLPSSLTCIGGSAFSGAGLTEVTLPEELKSIEDCLFQNCANLETVVIPEGVQSINQYAFYGCSGLKDVTIPASCTLIGKESFCSCKSLGKITINCDVNMVDVTETGISFLNLGEGAFADCGELNIHVTSETNAASIGLAQCFKRESYYITGTEPHFYVNNELLTHLEIPSAVYEIPDYAFSNLCDIETISLPENLISIGERAFEYCINLKTVTFANALKTIGTYAFRGCTALSEVTFGKSIASIGSGAFIDCSAISTVDIGDLANWCGVDIVKCIPYTNNINYSNPLVYSHKIIVQGKELDKLVIPSTVTVIKDDVFNSCTRFSELTISKTVTSIGNRAFANCIGLEQVWFANNSKCSSVADLAFFGCKSLMGITLPSSLSSLDGAFEDCCNLQSIVIPENITEIAPHTFYGCSNLKEVTLPQGLKTIRNTAFYECKSLEQIEIPSSVTRMEYYAFYGCNGLNGVYITDLAAWCQIAMPTHAKGGGWAVDFGDNNPLKYAGNLYLNGELVTDLVIPDGVETICEDVFEGALCLTSVVFPEGCKSIGGGAFWGCYNLASITIPSSMEEFGLRPIDGCSYGPFCYIDNSNNRTIELHLSDLEKWVSNLSNNSGLSGNQKSSYRLYIDGTLVNDLVIPETCTKISSAFKGFTFKSVTLPSSIVSIDGNAFAKSSIDDLYCRSKFCPTGADGIVANKLNSIWVPIGRADTYKNIWTRNASIIKETPDSGDFSGEMDASSISEAARAHASVYGTNFDIVNLWGCTLDDDVTAETLAEVSSDGSTIFFLPDGTTGIEGDNIVVNGHTTKLTLRDGIDFASPCDFTADELVYTRKFEKEATTLCVPFDMPALPEGMHAYTMSGQDENGNVVFDEVQTIAANTPYLVIAEKPIDNLQGTNIQFKATPSEMDNAGSEDYEFYGTLSEIPYNDASYNDAYVLDDNMKWVSVCESTEAIDIAAGRAYIIPVDGVDVSIGTVFTCDIPVLNVAGDANGDYVVDVTDIVVIANYILGSSVGTVDKKTVDVNGDGYVDVTDIVSTANIILHSSPKNAPSIRQQTIDPQ